MGYSFPEAEANIRINYRLDDYPADVGRTVFPRRRKIFEVILVEPTFQRRRKYLHLLSLSRHLCLGGVVPRVERSVGAIRDSVIAGIVWGQGPQRDADK